MRGMRGRIGLAAAVLGLLAGAAGRTRADFIVNTGIPDGLMAMASRPENPSLGKIEIEAADDFILSSPTQVTNGSFTGLLTGTLPTNNDVRVEIYRVFSADSDTNRTPNVPTRANSPSDVAFKDSDNAGLSFQTTILNPSFTASNSVLNGIHPSPNQTTGGEGPVTGQEVQFTFTLAKPFELPAGHYFFIPQVNVTDGEFYWLSSPRTPPPFPGDLQAWIRNADLDPDWLRVGTDIVGGNPAPTFNASFVLNGIAVPEPPALVMGGTAALVGLGYACRRRGVAG
jgi:hypothetical protein